jgi:hypothetical protein
MTHLNRAVISKKLYEFLLALNIDCLNDDNKSAYFLCVTEINKTVADQASST